MFEKLNWFLVVVLGSFLVCFVIRSCHFEGKYKEALDRAETAEHSVSVLQSEKERLETALEAQEKATAEAQENRKVVYKTVQKEVAKDETARAWYGSPIPESLIRVLKANAGAN